MIHEMAKALALLSGARRFREWEYARSQVLAAWPELVAAWHALTTEVETIKQQTANTSDAAFDAVAKVAILEDALKTAIAERDAADARANETGRQLEETAWRNAAKDAWVFQAKRVTEAAKAWRRSPMSDSARKELAEATLALEAS